MASFMLLSGAIGVWFNEVFADFDLAIFSFFGSIQSNFLNVLAKIATAMGSTPYVVGIGVIGLVMIFIKRTRKLGVAICMAVGLGTIFTNFILKPLALRVRPYNILQGNPDFWKWYVSAGMLCESDYSFPSGHTTGAFDLASVLFIAHARSKKKPAKAICWVFLLAGLFTGCSRIYWMVHYPTDVIAGILCGTLAGVIGYISAYTILYKVADWILEKLIPLKIFTNQTGERRYPLPVSVLTFAAAWVVCLAIGIYDGIPSNNPRCAYSGEYNCQNVIDEDYPAIDGENYCEIHYKQLTSDDAAPLLEGAQ